MLLRTLKTSLNESCYDTVAMQKEHVSHKAQLIVNLFNGYGTNVIKTKVTCLYSMNKKDRLPVCFKGGPCKG